MSSASSMLQHLRNYATGGVFSAIVGLISFPILTRALEVEEYGVLGLITATLTLFVALGKMGVQHSVVRFHAQVKNDNSRYSLSEFYTTVLLLITFLSLVTMTFWWLAGTRLVPTLTENDQLQGYFLVATLYIFFRMIASSMVNVLNAEQNSQAIMKFTMVRRISYVTLLVALVLISQVNVYYVLICYVFSEVLSMLYVYRAYKPGKVHEWSAFNSNLAKSLMMFGMPLMILESLGLLLRLSDRYIIQMLMGESALGQYAASYNLTAYLEIILITSLISAVKPRYNELWESGGAEGTREFLSNGLHLYLMVAIPFVAIFSVSAPHLMNILASSEFAPGTVIIPWVTMAILFDGAIVFLAAGLYIKKDTRTLVLWGTVATVLNIVLNLVFIPIYGILGASVVTVISFACFAMGLLSSSFKVLSFHIDLKHPCLLAVCSFIVWYLLSHWSSGSDIVDFIVKGAISSVVLLGMVLVIDRRARDGLFGLIPSQYLRSRSNES